MRRQEDEAYVLATHPLGDADLIVTLLARETGKIRAVARSARRSRRRFGGRLEPLTAVRAAWFERDGRELHRLDSLECVRSFAEMQADPARQAACAVLAELTIAFAHEGQGEPEAFRLVGAVLDAMETGVTPASLLRYFEYWTLRIHGLLPDLGRCASCSRPSAEEGRLRVVVGQGVRCGDCPAQGEQREVVLGGEERRFLAAARRRAPADMSDAQAAARPGGALERLLRGTLESFAEKRFRAYRHFNVDARLFASGDRE